MSKLKTVTIMDIKFINVSKKAFLEKHLYPRLLRGEKSYIVTANPEIVMRTREDSHYKHMVQQADYIAPDGAGVVLASKYLKEPVAERIAGFDLMLDLLTFAEKNELTCYFLGAKKNVNDKLIVELKKLYPKLIIAGKQHGYFSMEDQKVVNEVKTTNPDLVFVALGSPRQEQWITNNMHIFSKGLFMGVGGSFDVLAGEVKRAPNIWIKFNLEWFYRLLRQPFRWKRILKAIEFIIRIMFKKW